MRKNGPDILVFPPLVSIAAPVVAIALEWTVPLGFLPGAGTGMILIPGLAILFLSAWLAISGVRAFKKAGTNVDPRDEALLVVTDGPYRFTRNPMYLGMILLQIGLALTFSLDWALLGALLVWAILHYGVVLREEAYLSEKFGSTYTDFLATRRRWI